MSDAAVGALWAKGLPLDQLIHRFTVGNDPHDDRALLAPDCVGSAAHARMLAEQGLLSAADASLLVHSLAGLRQRALRGELMIAAAQEDAHTAIEQALTAECGEAGKRIHLGRSRNDQVILALRLHLRERWVEIADALGRLAGALHSFAAVNEAVELPGYTHLRAAMPSSWGQWGVAQVETALEDLEALDSVWSRLDRCPLGAAAGFGVPLPLNRERVAQLLGFSRVQRSPIAVQNSRGRIEQVFLDALASMAAGIEKWVWDLSLYSMSEFGFVRLPDAYTTGSSIMPQKRNPDVLELARARCRELRGMAEWHRQIVTGLPGNYHRDLQLHKRPLLLALDAAQELLEVLTHLLPALIIDAERCRAAMRDELYATEAAYRLVAAGASFRDAYREVGTAVISGQFHADRSAPAATHTGGLGSLALDAAAEELAAAQARVSARRALLTAIHQSVFAIA